MALADERYDVVVAGGGAAGVAAASAAAREGARTLLLERYGFLGGAATVSNVLSYCGLYVNAVTPAEIAVPAIGGVGAEVLVGLGRLGVDVTPIRSPSGNWIVIFDPEALKLVLDETVAASGATCHLHSLVTGAVVDGETLQAVRVTDHRGTRTIGATAFVDASGNADLAAWAGLAMTVDASRGDRVQSASFPVRIGGVPLDLELSRDDLAAIAAEVNLGRNAIRVRDNGGSFLRLPFSGERWWMCIDLATDGLSGASLSEAERTARRLAWDCLLALRHRPGLEHAFIVSTGPQLGIRETKRPRARLMMTGADALAGTRSADGIARAAWPMEVHAVPGKPVFHRIGGDGFFDVRLPALQAAGLDNLWLGGRLIGADAEAYGSVRVMGTGFATGQAAGVAAMCQADGAGTDATRIRAILETQAALV